MLFYPFRFLIGLVILVRVNCRDGPQVQISQGTLQGTYMRSKNGREFHGFLGIPFAKPPINELRFKAPVPGESWSGIRNATTPHPICPQRDVYRRASLIEGQEDCLYLNVYTPQIEVKKPYPVMVFFHGGGWLCGGGNNYWYGPNVLLDKDVVLVVTNYRLGALGFLSTGDETCPGNNGLKDQNLALKWISANIRKFGGDPNSVTLFGESAGGASVHYHMISPMSKGLFHRAISQSGTALCPWAIAAPNQGVHNSRKLANYLNCPTSPSDRMLACLRKIDTIQIISQDRAFMEWDTDPMIPFKPVVEVSVPGAFLTEHPLSASKAGRIANVPWIVGLTSQDGALRGAALGSNPYLMQELNEDFDAITPVALEYDLISAKVDGVTKKIRQFYFGDKKVDNSTIDSVVNMFTDGWFLYGADQAAQMHSNIVKQQVFYYLFAHRGVSSFTEIFGDPINDYGVCHADELQYLFPMYDGLFKDKKMTSDDERVMDIMATLWTNFAIKGDPTPETNDIISEKWKPLKTDNMEYYYIDSAKIGMRDGLLLERAKFWRTLPIFSKNNIKDEL